MIVGGLDKNIFPYFIAYPQVEHFLLLQLAQPRLPVLTILFLLSLWEKKVDNCLVVCSLLQLRHEIGLSASFIDLKLSK